MENAERERIPGGRRLPDVVVRFFIRLFGWRLNMVSGYGTYLRCRTNKLEMRRLMMPKDSQPDNKKVRMEKAKGQIPITRENQNQNRNAKKQSIKNNDV